MGAQLLTSWPPVSDSVRRLAADRNRRFCKALHEEIGGCRLRYVAIAVVARRGGLEEREAVVLATDLAAAGYLRLDIKGPPYQELPGSATLTDKGWRALSMRVARGRRSA